MLRNKFTGIFCVLLTCVLCISSCGIITLNTKDTPVTTETEAVTSTPDTETDPPETVESAPPPIEIPDPKDWEIRRDEAQAMLDKQISISFEDKILLIVDSAGTLSDPLIENNIYSEAVYERYELLSEKYGMKISVSAAERESLYDEYIKTINGGNTYCDMLSVPLRDTARFIQSGYIQNLRSLPFFKASGDYSIPSFDASRSLYDDVWFSVGYSTLAPDDLGCLYFNRTLASNADIDLYSLVGHGEFTIEKYLEILTVTGGSVVCNENSDLYLTSLELSDARFFETGYGTGISLSSDVFYAAVSAVTDILSVLHKGLVSVPEGKTSSDIFAEGETLFRIGTLNEIEEISKQKLFFGVLPMPKTDLESDHKTPVSDMTAALMITRNTANTEVCSVTLSALNAISYKWLLDSAGLHYVNYYVPDIGSADMIRIITENPVLDFSASARHLTSWYDALIYDAMKKKLEDPAVDLSGIFTAASLRSFKADLNKYYN